MFVQVHYFGVRKIRFLYQSGVFVVVTPLTCRQSAVFAMSQFVYQLGGAAHKHKREAHSDLECKPYGEWTQEKPRVDYIDVFTILYFRTHSHADTRGPRSSLALHSRWKSYGARWVCVCGCVDVDECRWMRVEWNVCKGRRTRRSADVQLIWWNGVPTKYRKNEKRKNSHRNESAIKERVENTL